MKSPCSSIEEYQVTFSYRISIIEKTIETRGFLLIRWFNYFYKLITNNLTATENIIYPFKPTHSNLSFDYRLINNGYDTFNELYNALDEYTYNIVLKSIVPDSTAILNKPNCSRRTKYSSTIYTYTIYTIKFDYKWHALAQHKIIENKDGIIQWRWLLTIKCAEYN